MTDGFEIFQFTWDRDPTGYELIDTPEGPALQPRSGGKLSEAYNPFELGDEGENYLAFQVVASSKQKPADILKLANMFGLVHKEYPEPIFYWDELIAGLKAAVGPMHRWDPDALRRNFGKRFPEGGGLKGHHGPQLSIDLVPSIDGDGLKMKIVPVDLASAIWVQFAQTVSMGMKVKWCENCGMPFGVGPTTGRRGRARFCKPKCQQAHAYRQRKGGGK